MVIMWETNSGEIKTCSYQSVTLHPSWLFMQHHCCKWPFLTAHNCSVFGVVWCTPHLHPHSFLLQTYMLTPVHTSPIQFLAHFLASSQSATGMCSRLVRGGERVVTIMQWHEYWLFGSWFKSSLNLTVKCKKIKYSLLTLSVWSLNTDEAL